MTQAYGKKNFRRVFLRALKAIAEFTAGRLRADSLDELADILRDGKHEDPVLGAICAYLYRAIADFDNIRRMAYFYARNEQPVPFDIALLGAMTVTADGKGGLRSHVPAVKARKGQPGELARSEYVTRATPATQATIGGRCPWLGLGWDYVGLHRPDWAALVDGLVEHAPQVPRTGFTVLPPEVGRTLATSWNLKPR